MNSDFVKCCKCGKLMDEETEAIVLKGEYYCIDHYEKEIQDEQDEEYGNEY